MNVLCSTANNYTPAYVHKRNKFRDDYQIQKKKDNIKIVNHKIIETAKWLHQKIFSAKIFPVENYTVYLIIRLKEPFYRVADFLLGRPRYTI